LINDESNHFGSNEMGSQYDDEQELVANENVVARPNQKRSKNFSLEEESASSQEESVSVEEIGAGRKCAHARRGRKTDFILVV
jgi:hypothetical protein